jgi:Carboxypeptidase regulatory-like domain
MKRLSDRQIRRLLSARATPEAPAGLADRIKAEMPELLKVGGAGPRPAGAPGVPPRSPALRPLWLLAASLLVVIGVGFVAVRLFTPPSDIAREIALGGVVRIEDIVVTVPERSTVEKRTAASGSPVAPIAGIPAGHPPGPVTAWNGTRTDSRAAGARGAAEPGPPAGGVPPSAPLLAAPRPGAEPTARGSLVVTVHDPGGEPLPEATVLLTLSDRPDVGCGFRVTGRAGVATFCCVAPGTYRVCAQLQGFTAASADGVVVPPARQRAVDLTLPPTPAGGGEHRWTCPTPRPVANR